MRTRRLVAVVAPAAGAGALWLGASAAHAGIHHGGGEEMPPVKWTTTTCTEKERPGTTKKVEETKTTKGEKPTTTVKPSPTTTGKKTAVKAVQATPKFAG